MILEAKYRSTARPRYWEIVRTDGSSTWAIKGTQAPAPEKSWEQAARLMFSSLESAHEITGKFAL